MKIINIPTVYSDQSWHIKTIGFFTDKWAFGLWLERFSPESKPVVLLALGKYLIKIWQPKHL